MTLTTFAMFAFGSKAFCNYYFFVIGALCCAIAAIPLALDEQDYPKTARRASGIQAPGVRDQARRLSACLTHGQAAPHDAANKRRNTTKYVPSHPLLFDLGARKPTTRQIADVVKQGGTAALTEAERRADQRAIRK